MRANPVSDAQLRAEYDKLVVQLARRNTAPATSWWKTKPTRAKSWKT